MSGSGAAAIMTAAGSSKHGQGWAGKGAAGHVVLLRPLDVLPLLLLRLRLLLLLI